MEESPHKTRIVEVKFQSFTSRIHTYLGRVYVHNFNDFNDKHYHLDTASDEWLISYMRKHHVSDVNEEERHNYIGKQTLVRTNFVLMRLLNLPSGMTTASFAESVQRSNEAKKWASGLHRARNLVNSWFSNGCPLNEQDLQQVIEWSQQHVTSDESTMSKGVADAILRARRNKEHGNEARNKESIHAIPKPNFSEF